MEKMQVRLLCMCMFTCVPSIHNMRWRGRINRRRRRIKWLNKQKNIEAYLSKVVNDFFVICLLFICLFTKSLKLSPKQNKTELSQ